VLCRILARLLVVRTILQTVLAIRYSDLLGSFLRILLPQTSSAMSDPSQRIVVTGMGVVSPVGLTNRETFEQLVAGRSGVSYITQFDPARLPSRIAAEVKGFNAADHMDRKAARRIGRYAQFAIGATGEAIREAGLNVNQLDSSRIATLVASAIG